MITRLIEIIRHRLGWCPNAGTIRTAPVLRSYPSADINPAQPEGRLAGSGRIRRGATLALGSIRILLRNRRLLWFSLLTGLVMIFSLASNLFLQLISGITPFPGTNLMTGPVTVLITRGSPPWIVLTFTTGLIISFLTYYLLAALIACVSLILSGRAATIRDGLAHAGNYLRPLLGWAVIGGLIGTVYSYVMYSSTMTNGSTGTLGMTYIAMAFLAVFYILTMFVVPLLVLGNESLINAVTGSLSLFGKVWGEILVCLIILFLIAFAVLLISQIPMITIGFSTAAAGAIVVAYMLVMLVLLVIGSTVLGIAIVGLYTYGKTGRIPVVFEGKQEVQAAV